MKILFFSLSNKNNFQFFEKIGKNERKNTKHLHFRYNKGKKAVLNHIISKNMIFIQLIFL